MTINDIIESHNCDDCETADWGGKGFDKHPCTDFNTAFQIMMKSKGNTRHGTDELVVDVDMKKLSGYAENPYTTAAGKKILYCMVKDVSGEIIYSCTIRNRDKDIEQFEKLVDGCTIKISNFFTKCNGMGVILLRSYAGRFEICSRI